MCPEVLAVGWMLCASDPTSRNAKIWDGRQWTGGEFPPLWITRERAEAALVAIPTPDEGWRAEPLFEMRSTIQAEEAV